MTDRGRHEPSGSGVLRPGGVPAEQPASRQDESSRAAGPQVVGRPEGYAAPGAPVAASIVFDDDDGGVRVQSSAAEARITVADGDITETCRVALDPDQQYPLGLDDDILRRSGRDVEPAGAVERKAPPDGHDDCAP